MLNCVNMMQKATYYAIVNWIIKTLEIFILASAPSLLANHSIENWSN